MADKSILLVLPGLFPEYDGDPKGVFVPDYIKAVAGCTEVKVIHLRAKGKPGIHDTVIDGVAVKKIGISENTFFLKAFKPFIYAYLFYKGIVLARREKDIQLIHAHGVAFNGLLAVLIAKFTGAVTVLTEHTPSYKIERSPILRALFSFAVRHADIFLTVSKHQQQQYSNCGMQPRQELVTYNPVDTSLFTPGLVSKENFTNMLFVGRLVSYKGVQRILRAFLQLSANYPQWTCTICGNGPEYENCRQLVAGTDLEKRVVFIPQASRKIIAEQMRQSSFLIFPSEQETFGLVIAEAMSAGLPVVAGNTTAQPEQIHAGNGITVDPFNDDAVKTGMEYMMKHYATYNSETIRKEVIARFGYEAFGTNMCAIYQKVIQESSRTKK